MIDGTVNIICAWCQREERPAFLGETEPLDDPSDTHGICRRHVRQMLAALPAQCFPDVTDLLIVKPKETALYAYLERSFLGVRGVRVIMERRREERRHEPRRPAAERRRGDRRRPRGICHALGYTTVRFRRGRGRGSESSSL